MRIEVFGYNLSRILVTVSLVALATSISLPLAAKSVRGEDYSTYILYNPYYDNGNWYKGNTHTHTTNSDVEYDNPDVVENWYKNNGYAFIVITDYNYVTPDPGVGILHIYGEEDGALRTGHIVALYGENTSQIGYENRTLQERVNDTIARGGLAILAHPNDPTEYYTLEQLISLDNYVGIEIYNALLGQNSEGEANSTGKWDGILTGSDKRVWGFAVDDMHYLEQEAGKAWIVVKAPALTAESILDAISHGSFYSSTGPEMDISVSERTICVSSSTASYVTFYKKNGEMAENIAGASASYIVHGDEKYIRAMVTDENGKRAWSNPIFVKTVVDVFTSPSMQHEPPGVTLIYTVTVKNLGTENDNYDLTVIDNAGWGAGLSENLLEVPAGENRQTTLTVTIPEGAAPFAQDHITVVATSRADNTLWDNATCVAHAIAPKADFSLITLYKVGLDLNLYLENGSKLVVKSYTYENVFENENIVHDNFAPPWHVKENKNVPHPSGICVKKVRLDLTGENTEDVISTISSFVVDRDALWGRLMGIRRSWPYAPQPERGGLWNEIMGVRAQWPYAPS